MKSFLMKSALISVCLVFVGCFSNATAMNLKSLKKALGKAYSEKRLHAGTEIRYCPDNTCDVISFPSKVNQKIIEDFEWMYFVNASEYEILKKFQEEKRPNTAPILERYKTFCNDETPITPKCILRGVAKAYSIKVKSVRFDEGVEALMPNSLLNKNEIKR